MSRFGDDGVFRYASRAGIVDIHIVETALDCHNSRNFEMFQGSTKENVAVTFYSWSCRTRSLFRVWRTEPICINHLFSEPIGQSEHRIVESSKHVQRRPSDWFWSEELNRLGVL